MAEDSASEFEGAPSQPSSDAAAWAALSAASREKADAFLEEQKRLALEQAILVRLQAKELEHELKIRHWSLRVRHLSDVLKLTFEVGLALIVIAVVVFAVAIIWDAAHDHGVVVEAFQVPQDFTNRGVTGEAVAGDLLSMLAKMQDETDTARPAATYQNNWSDDFKVQIADTGISLGEINRYLHQWLGHQTQISGELARTADGIAVTVRVGDRRATFEGAEKDRDALLQKAAEAVYAQTQPYRYATWLEEHGRVNEAESVARELANDPSVEERTWANIALMNVTTELGPSLREPIAFGEAAVALSPDHPLALWDLSNDLSEIGHDEEALAIMRRALLADASPNPEVTERARLLMQHTMIENVDAELGDFVGVVADVRIGETLPDYYHSIETEHVNEIAVLGFLHDRAGLEKRLAMMPEARNDIWGLSRVQSEAESKLFLGDPADALRLFERLEKVSRAAGPIATLAFPAQLWPYEALALFETGKKQAAFAMIAKTPLDCMWCAIMRGRIDELAGNRGGAAFWYADATRQAPSVPFAPTYWGALLLREGQYDDAIAKFKLAHDKGPHFADPLEMWGEALMRENRSDLALAKFEEADKYAPNWGRLHLKWGEALFFAGKGADSKTQIAIASRLDLSPGDSAALKSWMSAHG